jgi:hypothetical protein
MSTKLVGPLYQLQNPAQSGGVAVTVGTRVVSPIVKRKKRIGPSYSPIFGPPVPAAPTEAEPFGTLPHVNAPVPGPIPTAKSAIGGPKPKPPSAEELLATALGPERETTVGKVIRK